MAAESPCSCALREAANRRRAFSLIELVIVVVILGVIAAIAIPRMSNAGENARASALTANVMVLNKAADLYAAEHEGRTIAQDASGRDSDSDSDLIARLMKPTLLDGTPDGAGTFGPYLRGIPVNPYNGLATIRIDGVADGAGLAGWRFNTRKGQFMPDDPDGYDLVFNGRARLKAGSGGGALIEGGAQMTVAEAEK